MPRKEGYNVKTKLANLEKAFEDLEKTVAQCNSLLVLHPSYFSVILCFMP